MRKAIGNSRVRLSSTNNTSFTYVGTRWRCQANFVYLINYYSTEICMKFNMQLYNDRYLYLFSLSIGRHLK